MNTDGNEELRIVDRASVTNLHLERVLHCNMTNNPFRIPVVIHADSMALAQVVAARIAEVVRAKPDAVLGLPTGATPIGTYHELIALHKAGLDLSRVRTFNLDEYYPIAPDAPQSYHHFMREQLFQQVNIDPKNIHIPRGDVPRDEVAAHCEAYERAIVEAGGIDFQLLGIGRDGHIGFNEPGSAETSRTRLVVINPITRQDAAGEFGGEANVPREAITMGIGTILVAREIILAALGEKKSSIIARAVLGLRTSDVPASLLQGHPCVTLHLDGDAAADLAG